MAKLLKIAQPMVVDFFDNCSSPAFKHNQLLAIYNKNQDSWPLPASMSFSAFVNFLTEKCYLRVYRAEFPYRPETLYIWRDVSIYCASSHLKKNGYLCHYSAMSVHELTDQDPTMIYLNQEQRVQPPPEGVLYQHVVDRVFKGKQRSSKNIAEFMGYNVTVVNGKNTRRLGVIEAADANGHPIFVTGLSRTLIDIAVRPSYSGGIKEVLEAYARASQQADPHEILDMLRELDYKYPYLQCIGFLMEASGNYSEDDLREYEKYISDIDFYLTYQMEKPKYSSRWKIWYPSWL